MANLGQKFHWMFIKAENLLTLSKFGEKTLPIKTSELSLKVIFFFYLNLSYSFLVLGVSIFLPFFESVSIICIFLMKPQFFKVSNLSAQSCMWYVFMTCIFPLPVDTMPFSSQCCKNYLSHGLVSILLTGHSQ